jgi:hypothetical protein
MEKPSERTIEPGRSQNSHFASPKGIGICVAVLLILLTLGPALMQSKVRALRIEQTNRLKTLGLAIRTAFSEHPELTLTNLDQLVGSELNPKDLIDPLSGKPFTLVGPIDEKTMQYPAMIVVYGTPERARGVQNVAMADGSVQGMNVQRFAAGLKEQAATPNKW